MKRIFPFFIFIFGLAMVAYCEQTNRIELNDGSVIEGKILSLDNGIYTLNSVSLGKIRIEAAKIKRIEMKGEIPFSTSNLPSTIDPNLVKSKADQIQQQITNDPEIMRIVNELSNDQQFQEAVKDPELVKAAKAQDIKTLIANKKFLDLIENAKVKEIKNKLQNSK
ncbi:MAG: hypothetical protein PHY88_00630 [Candidatus Omnitrophica bacterium]|jgi:hypothetical protein|nr:hypothetical protein [Candidatus Omnitrophota bacterium]